MHNEHDLNLVEIRLPSSENMIKKKNQRNNIFQQDFVPRIHLHVMSIEEKDR